MCVCFFCQGFRVYVRAFHLFRLEGSKCGLRCVHKASKCMWLWWSDDQHNINNEYIFICFRAFEMKWPRKSIYVSSIFPFFIFFHFNFVRFECTLFYALLSNSDTRCVYIFHSITFNTCDVWNGVWCAQAHCARTPSTHRNDIVRVFGVSFFFFIWLDKNDSRASL